MTPTNRKRVALITGGARGIGFASALRLAKESVRCVLVDLKADAVQEAAKKLGPDHLGYAADVTKAEEVAAMFAAAKQKLGTVNVLVNSAGVTGPNMPTWEAPPAEVRQVMEVNYMGTFLTCAAAAPEMMKEGWGRIVNIASVAGKEGNPGLSAYSASKGAVIAFTKALGKELVGKDVLANAIAPAVIRTEMIKGVSQEMVDYMTSKIPMGRLGSPEEVAELVAFLASERVSFSTGATYDISGGRATY